MELQLNGLQIDALQRIGGSDDNSAIRISRRDSLDNYRADGFIIVSVYPHDGPDHEVAISEVGSISHWADGTKSEA